MKSALHQISDKEYLRCSWKAISRRNKRSKGLDEVTIAAFRANLEENLSRISSELRTKTYVFNRLRAHAMGKPGSRKKRPLQIAAVRDRVVMKALAMFISPAFDRFNLPCSFAYIKERGVDPVVSRIHDLVAHGKTIYLEADIIDFFGSVDRELLWDRFSKHVRHKSIMPLLRACFDLELGNLEDLKLEDQSLFVGADTGIPQGGVLSPMLANFYLYEFDRKLLDNGFNLVRYADDFVVMCESEERAREAHQLCEGTLKTLGLEIHPIDSFDSKTRIANFQKNGLRFLGLHFEGKDVFPAEKVRDRFKAKITDVLKQNSGLSLFKTLQKISNLIHGWGNYYRTMRVCEIYTSLDRFIQSSVEIYLHRSGIFLKRKNKRKSMKLLGIPSLAAIVERHKRISAGALSENQTSSKAKTVAAAAVSSGYSSRPLPMGMTVREISGSLRLVPIKTAGVLDPRE